MVPLPSLAEIPQLQALQSQVRRLWAAQTVVVLASDRGLWIAWPSDHGWQVAAGSWPEGCCRDGMPLQREAMAELLADLLLDNDLMDAQVELLLPLAGVHWRVLDGIEPGEFEQAKPELADLPWPLQAQESYTALTSLGTAEGSVTRSSVTRNSVTVALGVTRLHLQAWIDVVDQADLVLRRVDWCLTSALRGLLQLTHSWSGHLAWLIQEGRSCRLVLLSNGVPELDQLMTTPASDLEGCQREVRAWLTAWQQRSPSSAELGWWLSVAHDQADLWRTLVDEGRGECLLHQDLPPFEQAMDSDPSNSLEALEHLALFGSLIGEAVA